MPDPKPVPYPLTENGQAAIRSMRSVKLDDAQAEHSQAVADAAAAYYQAILENTPPGRAQSVAITNLEQSAMWATKAIALGPGTQPTR